MSSILKKKAEEIRDEVKLRANSPKRVGGLLVEMIQQIELLVSDKKIAIESMKFGADKDSAYLSFDVVDENNNKKNYKLDIPIVSETLTGVLTPEELSLIHTKIEKVNSLFTEYNVSANHPTEGVNGTNIYTFGKAIIKVPATMRNGGVKCVFLAYDLGSTEKTHAETWIFDGGIFVDKSNWKQWATQTEQEDIAKILQESLNSLNQEINKEMTLAISQIDTKVDEAVKDKTSKPLIISQAENKAGTYNVGGESLDIWERSVQLLSLPKAQEESKEYVIADEPLGFGTYVSIESFVASTGKGLNKEFFNFNYDITRFYVNSQLQSC